MIKNKDKVASGLGSILEWYDFALYGFFAPIIAELYFPSASLSISLLKTFSVFSIGFFARPIGALLFGYISDKYGRTKSLKLTPILITIPTLFFSVLPGYQKIGILAPIFLILLRIWQGICIGGEYANNIVYLCETASSKRLYFYGSIGSCTGSFGIFLASTMAAFCYQIFSHEHLILFGWRLAFGISFIIGIVVYFMRKNMLETSAFKGLLQKNSIPHNPILVSYNEDIKNYLISFGLIFFPATAFYYIFMFLPSFLTEFIHTDASKILGDNSFSLFLRLLIIPCIGLIADKIGGIRIARLACILFLFLSYPLFLEVLYDKKNLSLFIYAFALLTTLNAATTPGLLIALLKPKTRCTVLSFSFNMCFGVFGGMVPVVSFFLMNQTGNVMASVYYLMFAALITFITTFFFKEYERDDAK